MDYLSDIQVNQIVVKEHAAIGQSAAISATNLLNVTENFTVDIGAAARYGAFIYPSVSIAAGGSGGILYGIGGIAANSSASNATTLNGLFFEIAHSGAGTLIDLYGAFVMLNFGASSGQITRATGLRINNYAMDSSNFADTVRGIWVDDLANWGTTGDTVYGVHVLRQDSGTTATRYGFFYGNIGALYWAVEEISTSGAVMKLFVYSDATRPSASTAAAGAVIYNSTDSGLNISDGTNWRSPTWGIT